MNIEFKRLNEVEKSDIIELMNNPLVRRQMPLLKGNWTEDTCDNFVASKEQLWTEHGYGPWTFVVNDRFAGWGGVQPEDGEADLALVLHPDFWGIGKILSKEDKYGRTPLHAAAAYNSNPDVVKALISAGAKVNAKDDKYDLTPLHLAAAYNSKSPYQM